jgi:four helix bundle protein
LSLAALEKETVMASKGFEQLEVYRLAEDLSDMIWDLVMRWDSFAKNSIGWQIVRAADSVGANIAEGSGRGTYKDNCHFAKIGRGSLYETRHFLRRAYKRSLLTDEQIDCLKPLIQELSPRLNAYIKSIGNKSKQSKQQVTSDK